MCLCFNYNSDDASSELVLRSFPLRCYWGTTSRSVHSQPSVCADTAVNLLIDTWSQDFLSAIHGADESENNHFE